MYITYDQWMELTKLGILKPRSEALKKVDKALQAYDKFPNSINLRQLKRAFDNWKAEKGAGWKDSERNGKGAVTDLDDMLKGPSDELTPMDFVIAEQQRRINTLFHGRQLVTKRSQLAISAASVGANIENIRRGAGALGAPVDSGFERLILETMRKFFGASAGHVSIEVEVAHYMGEHFLPDFMKSLVPYAGILTSGANAVFQFGKLAVSAYRRSEVRDCRDAVRTGDPREAVAAIERILTRDITMRGIAGTLAAFDAIARGAATAAAGPAAETIAAGVMGVGKLMHQVYLIGRDFQEKYYANGILSGPDEITYKVFDTYPLLGCYYVVCVDTSDVVNFMLTDIGSDDWMTDVEGLTKAIQPVLSTARILIDDARFEIPNMPKLPAKVDIELKKRAAFSLKRARAAIPF